MALVQNGYLDIRERNDQPLFP